MAKASNNPSSDEELTPPAAPPEFSVPLEELLRSSIFSSIEEVRTWVALFIGMILKYPPAIEEVTNRVSANSADLQALGMRTIVRNIKAQAVFLQAKGAFWVARGMKGSDQLLAILEEMRLEDATDEEFEAVCERFLIEFQAVKAELDNKNLLVVRIQNLLEEEIFRDRILETGSGLEAWQLELTQSVLDGYGTKNSLRSLSVAANALQRKYDEFFGLGKYSVAARKTRGSSNKSSQSGKNPLKLDADGKPIRRSTSAKEARRQSKR